MGVGARARPLEEALPSPTTSAVKARRVGWQVEFAPCGRDNDGQSAGKRIHGRVWRGSFLDVLSLVYALDADRGPALPSTAPSSGVPAAELPVAITVDPEGAHTIAKAAHSIHALAIALDKEASR